MPLNNQLGSLGTLGGINDADTGYTDAGYSDFFNWAGVTGGVTGASEPKFPKGWYAMTTAGQDDWIRRNPRTAAKWGLHPSTYYDSTIVDAGAGYSQPSGVSGVADYINGTGSGSGSGMNEVPAGASFRAVIGTASILQATTATILDPASVERDLARLISDTNVFNNVQVSLTNGGFLRAPVFAVTGTSKIERAHSQDILDDLITVIQRAYTVDLSSTGITVGSGVVLPSATNPAGNEGLPSLAASGLVVPAVLLSGLVVAIAIAR